MSMRYQAGFLSNSYFPLKVPNAPTVGTATATGGSGTVSVAFTAPSDIGGGPIQSYIVVSSPGGFTGTGATSPISVSGLTNGTAYTFKVAAVNAYGTGPLSISSGSATPFAQQQFAYTTPGTYSFVVPPALNPSSLAVVCIGAGGGSGYGGDGGGGAGGGLRYQNSITGITIGQSITVSVGGGGGFGGYGGDSSFGTSGTDSFYFYAGGGQSGAYGGSNAPPNYAVGGTGTTIAGNIGGGNGGRGGGYYNGNNASGGGGGAGGYAGNGGAAGDAFNGYNGVAGSGGGGGGGYGTDSTGSVSGGGGGTGILGQGSNGSGGTSGSRGGVGGSGGDTGGASSGGGGSYGGSYGGGAGGAYTHSAGYGSGGGGAVRILLSTTGTTRAFPSTNTGDL